MPTTNVNGAELYYEEVGDSAETIVFAHSMLFSCRMFDAQVEALKYRYRCLSFDFRGQGKSEVTEDGYDLETLYQDTIDVIERLGKPPVHFLGFSMGGMIGLRLAIRRPELLRSLILVDTSAGLEEPDLRRKAKVLNFVTRWFGTGATVGQIMPLFFSDDFLKDPDRQEQVKAWRGHFTANDRIGVTRAVKGVIGREPVADQLHKIEVPTLILNGEEDRATTMDKSLQLNEGIAGSLLVTIPRSGHMTPVEEPAAVNAALESFLASVEG